MARFIDMTGWVMSEHGVPESRLKVIERGEDYVDPHGNHTVRWVCECSCSERNRVLVSGDCLRKGKTLSCGCLRKEIVSKTNKRYNKYDLSGECGVGWTTNTNREFYFDLDDFDIIMEYCWRESSVHGVRTLITRKNNRMITMHILLGYKNHDHIDRNELNNRRNNLRPATVQQNAMNRSIRKDNTSGFIGVRWGHIGKKWIAQIKVNGNSIYLGSFVQKEDAIKARLDAELKYFGRDFAPQRHLFEEYKIKENDEWQELNVNIVTNG